MRYILKKLKDSLHFGVIMLSLLLPGCIFVPADNSSHHTIHTANSHCYWNNNGVWVCTGSV